MEERMQEKSLLRRDNEKVGLRTSGRPTRLRASYVSDLRDLRPMIQSEPLATSSALASEEIKPNEHCEQCKEAVGGRSQRNCTKLVPQAATTKLLSRFKLCYTLQRDANG